ncbi:N-6 DNA methylase [Helicobacter sp. 11S02596-1]|uniref:N-6 DNA methylase n=1 Tax=Helicobacter sp. 11S02596-1 TaxID=1476194 RepID=UPI000BA6FAB0|nr:N-6 DNA methylase [Helicobacter sp. 11S02596-1]PAF42864.1 hypothetical protein BJI48_06315 [Helicobacter sp. 11S02596-1]
MNNKKINYNERSWGIDVISQINIYCSQNNSPIKRAGGEITIKGRKNLFPDVVLYGDELTGSIIQGWELKMPDTSITDGDFIDNAKAKAQRLCLNSFLLWNVKEAILYTKQDDDFMADKNWVIPNIQTRDDVLKNEASWKGFLVEILVYLSNLFLKNEHKSVEFLELNSYFYTITLNKFNLPLASHFTSLSVKNYDFEIELDEWIKENSMQNEHGGNKYVLLAEFSILSWLNRILFSHYLKTFNANAKAIDTLNTNSSIQEVIDTFNTITIKCDFMNIFMSNLADRYISDDFFEYLMQFNALLKDFWLDKIDSIYFHKVIDTALSYSRKKIAGQFSTPLNLARYLTEITIKDRTADAIDPCCGSGTIAKAIYETKRSSGENPKDALNKIWASDKFAYPLQLCSLALSDPLALGCVVQVFKEDIFLLKENLEISFIDPYSGQNIIKKLPKMHAVVSNLPFVRFEVAQTPNADLLSYFANKGLLSNKRADLYTYIIVHLKELVENGGRIGVIVSNSWLATKWGNDFKLVLTKHFKILKIICSAKGRWFNNADVVATLLILENSTMSKNDNIEFVTTNTHIKDWNSSVLKEMIKATLSSKLNSKHITKQILTLSEIKKINSFGISWNALFSDFSWFLSIAKNLTKASDFINFTRGERRGWDDMFYPQRPHKIESEYIKPVLLNSRGLDSLVVSANKEAFCCSVSLSELKNKGDLGAYGWILKFQNVTNNKNKPLPEVLKRKSHLWYEMKPISLADMVMSVNPDKKLCVYRLKERSFVNQRLIGLKAKDDAQKDILHALLNSAICMLYIESIGFGRGLGVLDLNATNISKNLHILNPRLLSDESKAIIMDKFKPLAQRKPLDLPKELQSTDRIGFDNAILNAFDIEVDLSIIYETLLSVYNIRKAINN